MPLIQFQENHSRPTYHCLLSPGLFWVDPIEHMILMGKNVGKVVQVQPVVRLTGDAYPENIVVKGEEVFFTDKTKQALQR